VSSHKIPAFDLLIGQSVPYSGFGDLISESAEMRAAFDGSVEGARARLQSGFHLSLSEPTRIPLELDVIVVEMWDQGWSPDTGNVNLFSTDFGLILAEALVTRFNGILVFRSRSDISHLSLWWPARQVEAFPFHHMVKCLYHREANSIASFAKGISNIVSGGFGG
jgi:hypothetical protein